MAESVVGCLVKIGEFSGVSGSRQYCISTSPFAIYFVGVVFFPQTVCLTLGVLTVREKGRVKIGGLLPG